MPTLQDPRHEAFAQARAKGALLIDAYESAGFVRHRGHPSRLALKDEVADRIAELRASQTEAEDVSPGGLLASLRRIIKAGENSENPALVNAGGGFRHRRRLAHPGRAGAPPGPRAETSRLGLQ